MPVKNLTQSQAAMVTQISFRRFKELFNEANPPPRNSDGSVPCEKFSAWLRCRITSDLGVTEEGEVYDYNVERARLTKEQADHEALKVAEKRGDLIPAELVAEVLGDVLVNIKAKILSLPNKLAHQVAGLSDLAEVQDILELQTREALGEMHHEGLQTLSRQGANERVKPDTPAAKADGERVGRH